MLAFHASPVEAVANANIEFPQLRWFANRLAALFPVLVIPNACTYASANVTKRIAQRQRIFPIAARLPLALCRVRVQSLKELEPYINTHMEVRNNRFSPSLRWISLRHSNVRNNCIRTMSGEFHGRTTTHLPSEAGNWPN